MTFFYLCNTSYAPHNYPQIRPHIAPMRRTFAKAVNVGAIVVGAALAVHQLTEPADQSVAVLVAVVLLVGQVDVQAALHRPRNAVRHQIICKTDRNRNAQE